jgi:hypothetical protein
MTKVAAWSPLNSLHSSAPWASIKVEIALPKLVLALSDGLYSLPSVTLRMFFRCFQQLSSDSLQTRQKSKRYLRAIVISQLIPYHIDTEEIEAAVEFFKLLHYVVGRISRNVPFQPF